MAKVRYSEVGVGQEFEYQGNKYTRQSHLRAKCVGNETCVSFKKHRIVECEYPYGGNPSK